MRSLRELPAEVRALVGVAFLVALGFGLVAPALPLFAREFGVSKALAGLVVSAFALMRLVMAPFVGRLVNALGERVLLASGIGIVAVSSLLAGFSQSYWQLLVLRGAGGVGSIMFSVSAASLLVRVTPDHQRGQAQGVWAGAFLLGMIAGPAVGTVATFSLRAPFFLYAGTLLLAGTVGLAALRGSELAAGAPPTTRPSGWRRRCATGPTSPRWPPRSRVTSRWSARGRRSCRSSSRTRCTCPPAGPTPPSSSSAWSAAPSCCRWGGSPTAAAAARSSRAACWSARSASSCCRRCPRRPA